MARSKFDLFKHGALIVVALLFLFANASTHKHLLPAGSPKLITLDHEVCRDLTRAEREIVKTSVLSGRGEAVAYPPQQAAATAHAYDILLNSYPLSHPPSMRQPRSTSIDFSPVLNL